MSSALAQELEARILAHRLANFDLDLAPAWTHEPDALVFPVYGGLSIINLAHTAYRLLVGGSLSNGHWGQTPLDERLWIAHQGQVKRVVLFISDGLGWRMINDMAAQDAEFAQIVSDLVGDGSLTPLTSIAPTTTAAALPAIWSGAGPAQTGLLGTILYLREYGVMGNLIHYTPFKGRHRPEALEDWGLNFETFVPLTTLGEALGKKRVPVYVLLQKSLFNSGMSRVMHRGPVQNVPHAAYTDLWIVLGDLLRRTRGERCFVNIYWSGVDSVSHMHGTVSPSSTAEIRRQLADLRDTLCSDDVADGQTLFMLVADHGHTPVPEHIVLDEYAPVAEAMRGWGGDARFTQLYLRDGARDDVLGALARDHAETLAAFDPVQALKAGLFGPGQPHPEATSRLGDLTVISRSGHMLVERKPGAHTSVSRHGGLSAREVLVPLLMRRL